MKRLLPDNRIPLDSLATLETWEFYVYDSNAQPPSVKLVLTETAFNNARQRAQEIAVPRRTRNASRYDADVMKLLETGMSVGDAAKKFGVREDSIRDVMRRAGMT